LLAKLNEFATPSQHGGPKQSRWRRTPYGLIWVRPYKPLRPCRAQGPPGPLTCVLTGEQAKKDAGPIRKDSPKQMAERGSVATAPS